MINRDFFRLLVGSITVNWRKSRCRGSCQNPSDSGKAGETNCEACAYWHKPSRFTRVCPYLTITPKGAMCSVDAKDTKPFWGRAVKTYAYIGGITYLVGCAIIWTWFFAGLKQTVKPLDVLLPNRWGNLRVYEANYYLKRASTTESFGERLLCLQTAYTLNPSVPTALTLAMLMGTAQSDITHRLLTALEVSPEADMALRMRLRLAVAMTDWKVAHTLALRIYQQAQTPAAAYALLLTAHKSHQTPPAHPWLDAVMKPSMLRLEKLVAEGKTDWNFVITDALVQRGELSYARYMVSTAKYERRDLLRLSLDITSQRPNNDYWQLLNQMRSQPETYPVLLPHLARCQLQSWLPGFLNAWPAITLTGEQAAELAILASKCKAADLWARLSTGADLGLAQELFMRSISPFDDKHAEFSYAFLTPLPFIAAKQ